MLNKHNITNSLILNIVFYINIKNKLIHNFNIFINKLNLNSKSILQYIKNNIKKNIMFNFRNKLNFNKSKRNIMLNKKKTGKARLGSSSSNILKKGLIWYGLRNIKIKKYCYNTNLLNHMFFNKKNIINIFNLEIIKFLKDLTDNNINLYNKIINIHEKKFIFIDNIKYFNLIKSKNIINLIH